MAGHILVLTQCIPSSVIVESVCAIVFFVPGNLQLFALPMYVCFSQGEPGSYVVTKFLNYTCYRYTNAFQTQLAIYSSIVALLLAFYILATQNFAYKLGLLIIS